MERRRFLAVAGAALLAGCDADSQISPAPRPPGATPYPTAPTSLTECRASPTAPADPSAAAAREFVAAHERALLFNHLVSQHEGPEECHPAEATMSVDSPGTTVPTSVDVGTSETVIAASVDRGHYVVSTCRGEAEYWCPDQGRACSTSRRNADFVTHFVGDEDHVRVPHDFISCTYRRDPYTGDGGAPTIDVGEDESGLHLTVYDFADEGPIDVRLTHEDAGDVVSQRSYEPPHGPSIHANVAVRTGAYRLVATTEHDAVTHQFTLDGTDDPALNGVCVYRGPMGRLTAVTVATEGELAPPSSPCERIHRRRSATDA